MKSITIVSLLAMGFLFLGCQTHDPIQEATAQLKPIVHTYVHAWSTGNLDTLNGVLDAQVVRSEGTAGLIKGLDSLKKYITYVRIMFPDFKVTIDEELYVGNHAILRWTISGTNTGPSGTPPTGKAVKLTGLSLYRFVNGKLVEEHAENDWLSFWKQLGFKLVPPAK